MGKKVERLVDKLVALDRIDGETDREVGRLSTLAQDQWPVKGQKRWKVSSYVEKGGRVVNNRPRKWKKRKKKR